MKRFRVYLSSTYEDLKEYRAAVFAALERAGLDVARMEAYTAADERPLDKCLRDVAQSDIYVGLFAWRYGYEPPAGHGDLPGKSITELEYRQAERRNLRKLLFFAHSDTKATWPERFKDEVTGDSGRGEKQNSLRKELGTEKAASFFHTPDELATLVLAAIMRTGLSGRPYNVPPRPAGLVPRPDLTKTLVDSLCTCDVAEGAHTIVQGAGGTGKTTLALDACHTPEIVRKFPDGMLWATLGEKPDLARILADLHVTATGSPAGVIGVDAIGQALGTALAGRQCLVVIDDAWRTEDLQHFLALEGPQLLITTRIRNLPEEAGRAGWREVPVDEMDPEEGATLLGRGLPLDTATRQALRNLTDRLGCWPLLLGLVNSRLLEEQKSRRGTPAECIDRVANLFDRRGVLGFDRQDSKARNAAVAKSVAVGLEFAEEGFPGIGEKAAEISVFPEDTAIPVRVLADLWAMGELDVEEEVVRPLDNVNVLRWGRQTNDVVLHDMIQRALAARLAEPAAVHRRLLDSWCDPYHLPHDHAWRWFGWHCLRALEPDRLLPLLLDFDWLNGKLEATDVTALISDFDYLVASGGSPGKAAICLPGQPIGIPPWWYKLPSEVTTQLSLNPQPLHRDPLALIQGAIRLSAHVLARDKKQLAGQLLGRLLTEGSSTIRATLEQAKCWQDLGDPWLRPTNCDLTPPGGPLVRVLTGHPGWLNGVVVTPDGQFAISASAVGTLMVWDLVRWQQVRTIEGHTDRVNGVALTPDSRLVISASHDESLKVWELKTGRLVRTLKGHTAWVKAVAVTPDGLLAISASWDKTLKVWELANGREVMTLKGHATTVSGVAVTPNGQVIISASHDGTLRLWDVRSGRLLQTLMADGPVEGVAVTPDGKLAISASRINTLQVWEIESGREVRTLKRDGSSFKAVAVTPDGQFAVTASADPILSVWELTSGREVQKLPGHFADVNAVGVTPDGQRVISASGDSTIRIWELGCGGHALTAEARSPMVSAVALFKTIKGNTQLAITALYNQLSLWELESRRELWSRKSHTDWATCVAVTPDGRLAISASYDKTLKVWEVVSGRVRWTLSGHTDAVNGVAVTPDCRFAVSASDDCKLIMWELDSGRMVRTFKGHNYGVNAVAVTADGDYAISASQDKTLAVWDLWDGREVQVLEGHADAVTAVAVIPHGRENRLISASSDHTLRVWDVEGGREVRNLKGHSSTVTAVAVTPDGQQSISVSSDGTLRMWELESGREVCVFTADVGIETCAVAPDGCSIVAVDKFGQMHFLTLQGALGRT